MWGKGKAMGGGKGGGKCGGKDMWSDMAAWFGGGDAWGWGAGKASGKSKGGGKGFKSSAAAGPAPSDELVARVKAIQRMEGGKDLWTTFLERAGGSARDPARRTQQEVEQFLAETDPEGTTIGAQARPPKPKDGAWGASDPMDEMWAWMMDPTGQWSDWGGGGKGGGGKPAEGGSKYLPQSAEHANLVARVKAVQKSDKQEGTGDRWGDFCFERGGKKDPASRTPAELEEFLSMADPSGNTADVRGDFNEDMALIAKVKNGQRNNEAFKNAWLEYCDANHEGVRDPTRHSADTLRAFLASAPPITAVASDDEHRQLVETIKEGQRADENYKQAWWQHCEVNGSTFMDPAKHDKAFLKSFVEAFVVGQVPPQATGGYGKMSCGSKGSDKGKGKDKGKDKGKGKGKIGMPGPYAWW